jgi:23S rRNA (uracil1939-C5)-methyltransferase
MRKKKNMVLENLQVTAYAAGGKSLARDAGKVVFIEGAVPGDVVDVRLSKNKKDWAEGRVIRIREFSAERTTPFCSHFGVCGGCKWQMLPYDKQLEYKQDEVSQQMKRIGKVELPEMMPIVGARETRYYRNKLEFTFSAKKYYTQAEIDAMDMPEEGPAGLPSFPALGFHVPGSFDKVIDIDTCFLQADPSNAIRNGLRDYALQRGYTFYNIKNHTGLLRNLMIRSCTTGDLMVNLVFGEDDPVAREDLLTFLQGSYPDISSLYFTINRKLNDSIYDQEPILYHGDAFATEKLGTLRFRISPKSFFQTNTKQAERLYQISKDFAMLDGTQTVYDLYCGTGSIGIFLSREANKVIGVELIEEAVEDAHANAQLNQIDNVYFFAGDVAKVCTDLFFAEHGKPDVIITDPPRAGMHESLVHQILQMEAPVVVYVSCNPATQARDLQLLSEKYAVTAICPVDMFPHTHHIENVVQLKLKMC